MVEVNEREREEGVGIEGDQGDKLNFEVSHKFLIHQIYDKCYTCFYLKPSTWEAPLGSKKGSFLGKLEGGYSHPSNS